MSAIITRLRERLARRRERRAERAAKRQSAEAQRLQHKRLDDKYPH